jgi:hypothetical protein
MGRNFTARRFLDYLAGTVALLLASITMRPANVFADVVPVVDEGMTSGVEYTVSAVEDVDVDSDDEGPSLPE